MKLILLAAVVTFVVPVLVLAQSAKQTNALEQEIRKLDHAEADALLLKDLAVLEKLWQKILLLIIRVTEYPAGERKSWH
ncbi:MAG: hypothetical protein ACR2G5_10735 [Pyrinomonadaceae bacterium]